MDSKETFNSGAVREVKDGRRYDLIPFEALARLAATYAEGAKKYSDRNWEKGISFCNLYNHIMMHLESYQQGDRSEDHLAHAAWGLFAMMHHEQHHPEMDDWSKGGDTNV